MGARPALILASASAARAALLGNAGVGFETAPAAIDEAELKRALAVEQAPPRQVAAALADLKATRISARRPGALVVGADQVLACDGARFDKPADRAAARASLRRLRGRAHMLVTAACVARDGVVIWRHEATATLRMRPFSDAFMERYLDVVGARALESAGAYQLEGPGAQLFARVDGDFFTILGLPLLPLLAFLRGHGVIEE